MSTIRDVAKLANVSTATVSRIINNDTKYKIRKVIALQHFSATYKTICKVKNATRNEKVACSSHVTSSKRGQPQMGLSSFVLYRGVTRKINPAYRWQADCDDSTE